MTLSAEAEGDGTDDGHVGVGTTVADGVVAAPGVPLPLLHPAAASAAAVSTTAAPMRAVRAEVTTTTVFDRR